MGVVFKLLLDAVIKYAVAHPDVIDQLAEQAVQALIAELAKLKK